MNEKVVLKIDNSFSFDSSDLNIAIQSSGNGLRMQSSPGNWIEIKFFEKTTTMITIRSLQIQNNML